MPAILCHALSKTYGHGFWRLQRKVALANFSLDVARGEVFGIVGPNGAGKSTALKILMGLVRPTSGSAQILAMPASDPACHAHLGYLPENPSLYKKLTISEHLHFAGQLAQMPSKVIRSRTAELLALVDLPLAARIPIQRFSKGMTQRAALAYALFTDPEILILDEPMSGLDPLGRQLVLEIIRHCHNQGKTILFCSHILTDVERICSRIGIMHRGTLVAQTTPAELAQQVSASAPASSATPLERLFLATVQKGVVPEGEQGEGHAV